MGDSHRGLQGLIVEGFAKMLKNLGFLLSRENGFDLRNDKVRFASYQERSGCREDAKDGLEGGRPVRRGMERGGDPLWTRPVLGPAQG